MREVKNTYSISVGNPEVKISVTSPRSRWRDVSADAEGLGREDVNWPRVVQWRVGRSSQHWIPYF
jgi:hypothetical protein